MDNIGIFHDELCRLAEGCTEMTGYTKMAGLRDMLVISVIEEERFKTFLNGLLEHNPGIRLNVIVQDYVAGGFKKNFGGRCNIISWKGHYSPDTLEEAAKAADLAEIDSFVFFSDFAVNMRDMNFLEMAIRLNQGKKVETFCCTIGNDIYRYKDCRLSLQVLQTYRDMGRLVSLYLEGMQEDAG